MTRFSWLPGLVLLLLAVAASRSDICRAQGDHGFPADFPALVASGGPAVGRILTGFGGRPGLARDAQRDHVHRRPIVLLHGNGANVDDPVWGLQTLRSLLIDAGYDEAEIWAVSYLGAANSAADLPTPYRDNIDDVRRFVDAVRDYLGVAKVDLVGHSLGAGLAKAYVDGLGPDGALDKARRRFDQVGTLVALSGAFYGLGPWSLGEFRTGAAFEAQTHVFDGVTDDTPHGSSHVQNQRGPFADVSRVDDDGLVYVALWCVGDFIDAQNPGTGRLVGADLNQAFLLGWGLLGHAAMLRSPSVFEAFLPYLNTTRSP